MTEPEPLHLAAELKHARVAVVHDWLTLSTGGERVLEAILELFPQADVHVLLDIMPQDQRGFLAGHAIHTSFLQRMPFIRGRYRDYLPLMPLAVEQLDMRGYDLILSSSHAVAKGVLTGPDQPHLSYVHTPMRYIWDMQHEYLGGLRSWRRLFRPWMERVFHRLRQWDQLSAQRVDALSCNSRFVARRIRKFYRREAEVIPPPVDLEPFPLCREKGDYYLSVSRLVGYKKVGLVVEAFRHRPDRQLIVIGEGPEEKAIRKNLPANVTLVPYLPREQMSLYLQHARALVFAALEDFGITVVEAQACGTPVIAFGQGGARETVRGLDAERPTGVFFEQQNVADLLEALEIFEQQGQAWDPEAIRANAYQFRKEVFLEAFQNFVNSGWYNR